MSELTKCLNELNDAIQHHYNKTPENPKFIILPLAHRQALKLNLAIMSNTEIYEVPEVREYCGITILREEDVIIVSTNMSQSTSGQLEGEHLGGPNTGVARFGHAGEPNSNDYDDSQRSTSQPSGEQSEGLPRLGIAPREPY